MTEKELNYLKSSPLVQLLEIMTGVKAEDMDIDIKHLTPSDEFKSDDNQKIEEPARTFTKKIVKDKPTNKPFPFSKDVFLAICNTVFDVDHVRKNLFDFGAISATTTIDNIKKIVYMLFDRATFDGASKFIEEHNNNVPDSYENMVKVYNKL